MVHCWVLEQQTTRYAAGMFCVRVFGMVVSLVCPRLVLSSFLYGAVVGGCGVVVWLLHSGREHLVRMTLLSGVLFSCM